MTSPTLTLEQRKTAILQKIHLQKKMQKKVYDYAPWDECAVIAREVDNSKITSRFWERRIANELGWKTDPKRLTDSQDYGDIMIKEGIIGEDNIELKTTEKIGNYNISGGQMRFYEDIPWYMFMVIDDEFMIHIYVMHKDDIYRELFVEKVGIGSVSQGSGKTTHKDGRRFTQEEKLQLMKETFERKNDILWGFGINGKTQVDTKIRWDKLYKTTIDELKDWKVFKLKRNK